MTTTNDSLQLLSTNWNKSGSFSNSIEAGFAETAIEVFEYSQQFNEQVLGLLGGITDVGIELIEYNQSFLEDVLCQSDSLTGNDTSVNSEAVLDLALTFAQEQLESFATRDEEFLDKMNLAFGEDWQPQEDRDLIQDLANGEEMPNIQVLPATELDANGAFGPFGEDTIYLSEKFLSENADAPEAVAGVLLEEIGHYVDQELSSGDSRGDEGGVFARLVQGETISGAELAAIKAENDRATISLNGGEILVELAGDPTALVDIPSDINGVPLNEGLTSPNEEDMERFLGDPTDPNSNGYLLQVTQNVGPFEVEGLQPAVDALQRTFDKVEVERPDLYEQLTEAGMYNVREKRSVDGEIIGCYSNHSWGTATDIEIGDLGYDLNPDGLTYQGLVDLYPYFNAEKFYWGGALETNEDPIHFEASEELLAQWEDEGLLTPTPEPSPGGPMPTTPVVPPTTTPPPYPGYLFEYVEGEPVGNGEVDADVETWQQAMVDQGYNLAVDGLYGPESKQIATQFQQEKGLAVDGIVGPETWEASFPPMPVDPPMPVEPTDINQAGLLLVEEFEGYAEELGDGTDRVMAYADSGGVLTIGFGHTGPDVTEGLIITRAEAEQLLRGDLDEAEAAVSDLATVPLNENQFSALVSFVFNLGAGDLEESTLLELLNQGRYAEAADQFLDFNTANGVVLEGLTRRREEERELFLAPPVA